MLRNLTISSYITFIRVVQIIEWQFSEINIDDLVKKRESFIQDFTKRVLLKLNKPASDNYIDKELEFMTKQLGELNSSLSSEINETNQTVEVKI